MCFNPVPLYEVNKDYLTASSVFGKPSVFLNPRYSNLCFPCGGCLGCRVDNLLLWSSRCNYEFVQKKESAFVTLTYNKFFIHKSANGLEYTLFPDDLHKYFDNLRHFYKGVKDFSFFASSEYGGQFNRPHIHILFFGLDFQKDRKVFIDKWRLGHVESLPIINGGIRYVVDYFTKEKLTGHLAKEKYDDKGLVRPYISTSKGLGSDLFFQHRDEIRNGLPLKLGSRYIPVPAYYKNLYCTFSDSEIRSKTEQFYLNNFKLSRTAKSFGFDSVDSYMRYKAIGKEKQNEQHFTSMGLPHKHLTRNFYYHNESLVLSLAESALR